MAHRPTRALSCFLPRYDPRRTAHQFKHSEQGGRFRRRPPWPCQDSNLGATDYESAALPLSYRAHCGGEASTARGHFRCAGDGSGQGRAEISSREVLTFGDQALGQTLALIATFGGIGVIANLLILYVVAQVFVEHKQNQEHEPGADY